ncbi:MAG: transposase, partial [Acetobacteraceae bacterium]|nr:transposase [Acetobacteraceae bacterium]
WLIDGPINGQRFRTYVEKVLAPTLFPGDLVIADNLSCHKSKAVRNAIRNVGARLFLLPKYSPGLNPLEQVLAKFKHLLRKAAARTAKQCALQPARSWIPTLLRSAPITSGTADMSKPRVIPLWHSRLL